jgi:hypothetical protein
MNKKSSILQFLKNYPNFLDFTTLKCGKIKIAGIDDLFTKNEVYEILKDYTGKYANYYINTLEKKGHISIPVNVKNKITKQANKTAVANTAVIVDMYEVDYNPVTMGASTQAIEKNFDAVEDFVSRITFPDTTVSDIIVAPKEQIFKKKENTPIRPDLPQNVNIPTRKNSSNYYKLEQLIFSLYCAKEAFKVIKKFYPKYASITRDLINSMENYIENPNKKNKADIKVKQNLFNSVADKLFIKVAYYAGIVILYAADVFRDYYLINNIEYLYNQLNTCLIESKQSTLLDVSTLRNNAIKEAAKYVKPNNILDFFDRN